MTVSKSLLLFALHLTLIANTAKALGTVDASKSSGETLSCDARLASAAVTLDWLETTTNRQKLNTTDEQQRLRDDLQTQGFNNIIVNRKIVNDPDVFKFTKTLMQKVAANQKKSGRCWIFAFFNVLRSKLLREKKFDISSEISQAHAHFGNMLEKSNKILNDVINNNAKNMKPEKLRRVIANELANLGDGGEHGWDAFLVEKYGMVPKEIMPETASSEDTSALIDELQHYLGRVTVQINEAAKNMKKVNGKFSPEDMNTLLKIKQDGNDVVLTILTAHLGNFVLPNQQFTYRRAITKPDGTIETIIEKFTPKTFSTDFVGYKSSDYVVVSSTVLQAYNKSYVIKNSSIGVPEKGQQSNLRYINLPIDRLKQLVSNSIDIGSAVYFGSDVRHDVDFKSGIMDTEIFKTQPVYGFDQKELPRQLTHAEEVRLGIAQADHAMTFIGKDDPPSVGGSRIDYDPAHDPSNDPVKLQAMLDAMAAGTYNQPGVYPLKGEVENSWGGKVVGGVILPQNNLSMSFKPGNWFDRYVFEIAVPRSVLTREELAIYDSKPKVLKDSQSYYGFSR